MLELGKMKLALDEAVAGEEEEQVVEREMKTSLMNVVRKKLEVGVEDAEIPVDTLNEDTKTEDGADDGSKMDVDS